MATITFKNGDEYIARINKLSREFRESVAGPAIYEAAGIVADEIAAKLAGIPTDERWGTSGMPTSGPREAQAQGVYRALGIAKLQDQDGFINVKIGFDGYNGLKSARWPNGQPNQMVARSIERGTYFMQANPFVKPAVAATRGAALKAMKNIVDNKTAEIMKG